MTRPPNPQLVDALLTITTDLIAEKGADNVTLREIAQRAGVTATTIHYYFEDRRGLFEAAKLRAMAELDADIADAIDQNAPATAQLCALAGAFLGWGLEHPHEFALLHETMPPLDDPREELARQYYTAYARVRSIYERGSRDGEFAIDDVGLQAAVGFATIFGIVDLYLNRRLPPEYSADVSDVFRRAVQETLVTVVPEAGAARERVVRGTGDVVRAAVAAARGGTAAAEPAGVVVQLPADRASGGRPLADEELDELAAAGFPEQAGQDWNRSRVD